MTKPRQQFGFWILCSLTVVAIFVMAYRPMLIARLRGRGADLRRANLTSANLRAVDLTGAALREANLSGSDLRGATLASADLERARLIAADLTGANLAGANLERADMRAAVLRGADLRGADMRGTVLECCLDERNSTDLRGARYDAATRWPDGFIPEGHGARLVAR